MTDETSAAFNFESSNVAISSRITGTEQQTLGWVQALSDLLQTTRADLRGPVEKGPSIGDRIPYSVVVNPHFWQDNQQGAIIENIKKAHEIGIAIAGYPQVNEDIDDFGNIALVWRGVRFRIDQPEGQGE